MLQNPRLYLTTLRQRITTLQCLLAAAKAPLSTSPWDGSASRWKDPQSYCDACLHRPSGVERKDLTKAVCKLPVYEPDGKLSASGMRAAQGALVGAAGGVDLPKPDKIAAARKLIQLMTQHEIEPAESLRKLAED